MATYGLVLAGGQSSRMGRDKALLEWQGRPLFQHMQALLEQAGVCRVFLNGAQCGEEALVDRIPGKGPMSGIDAVLPHVPDGSRLLVVPVDMPLLPAEAIARLMDTDPAPDTPLHYDGFPLPWLLPVNGELRRQLATALHSSDHRHYALRHLHQVLAGRKLPLPAPLAELFHNTNTPADWESCKQIDAGTLPTGSGSAKET
ncbi:MAG: molybdenum cofactor guanylyltransferase [Endozoicomonas sp.]